MSLLAVAEELLITQVAVLGAAVLRTEMLLVLLPETLIQL